MQIREGLELTEKSRPELHPLFWPLILPYHYCELSGISIRRDMITNEDLEMSFRFHFRNGKANQFPLIFLRMAFVINHVGHAQATTAGHTYEKKTRDFLSLSPSEFNREKILNPDS